MTPSKEEVEAALKCLKGVLVDCPNYTDGSCACPDVLAAALRQAEFKFGEKRNLWKIKEECFEAALIRSAAWNDECAKKAEECLDRAEKAESRLKTLEEENAALRKALIRLMSKVEIHHGKDHLGESWDFAVDTLAALKQEAE